MSALCHTCRKPIQRGQAYRWERWRSSLDALLRPAILTHLACPTAAPASAVDVRVREHEAR